MVGTLGIVEVPTLRVEPETQRVKLNPAVRRFGDNSLLEWVVRRVSDALLLDQVIIVAGENEADAASQLAPPNVPVFVGRQSDSLGRFAAAAREFTATHLVRVSLASPFIDPELIDRLVCTARSNSGADYIGYVADRGGPAVLAQLGVFAEWCRSSAVLRADDEAHYPDERNDVTRFIYSHPELFRLRLIPVPPQLDRDDLRLTVDFEEDWDHAQIIFDALGPELLDWQRIAELLDQHPALRQQMAVLNRAVPSTTRA